MTEIINNMGIVLQHVPFWCWAFLAGFVIASWVRA